MKRFRPALVLAAVTAVATWTIMAATAQTAIPNYAYVKDSSGQVFVVSGGQRLAVPLYPATDAEIAAIPWPGTWIVPKADGSGYEAGARPEWAATSSPPAPAPPPPAVGEAIRVGGSSGHNTAPFNLAAGNYQVSWQSSLNPGQSSCFTSGTLRRVEAQARVESLFSATFYRSAGKASDAGETRVYGVQAGQHYVDTGTGSCAWSVEIKPM